MPIDDSPPVHGKRVALTDIQRDPGTHAGLWLDKGLLVLNPVSDEDKKQIRALLIAGSGTPCPEGYEAAYQRRLDLLETFDGGIEGGKTWRWEAKVQGRMIVGLGTESLLGGVSIMFWRAKERCLSCVRRGSCRR